MDSSIATLFVSFLIFFLTSAIKDQREIKAKPGHDVTLHCQSPRDASITLLEWSKADLKKDGYVFFYRNERSYENYQHPTFRGRVQLRDASSMKDGDVSVILKNVTVNDTGTYECRIIIGNTEGSERDRRQTSVIQLTVTDTDNTAGNTWTEGDEDGGDEDGGDEDGYNRTVVVLSVIFGIILLLLLSTVGLRILKKRREPLNSPPPPETRVLQPRDDENHYHVS